MAKVELQLAIAKLSTCTDFNESWYVVRVVTLDVAYQILANYLKPIPSNRGMYSSVWSNQGLDIHDAGSYTTSSGFYEKITTC